LPLDWTPETVIFAAIERDGPQPPFRIHVRIGTPITATGEPRLDLERLRVAVATLMEGLPAVEMGKKQVEIV